MNPTEATAMLVNTLLEKGMLSISDFENAGNYADVVAEAYKIIFPAVRFPSED